METTHRIRQGDARELAVVSPDAVELVVTSPPYPMIELWDETFCDLDSAIDDHLDAGRGWAAFEAMHAQLDRCWHALARVLVPGGIACINVGDATRSLDGHFQVYPNHARVIDGMVEAGFTPLPGILWRKPTNAATKFMGSGMLPPNAYATLEHEHILIFRNKTDRRSFPANDRQRRESAYFWEERNEWFSDLWSDITGTDQTLTGDADRERSGAFPAEVPFRLCNMYSVYGDTVLDPFCGTGTTSLAAIASARHSIGIEYDPAVRSRVFDRLEEASTWASARQRNRLRAHEAFVHECQQDGDALAYESRQYGFPVRTAQERDLTLYAPREYEVDDPVVHVDHDIVQWDGPRSESSDLS